MSNIKKILKIRNYKKWGYQLIYYIVDGSEFGGGDFEMCSSFTLPGREYIGNSKDAYRLCAKRGIKPERINPSPPRKELTNSQKAKKLLMDEIIEYYDFSHPCSIGFCEEKQEWYGWSHRAIYGFGVGSTVKKGHCAYAPTNPQDLLEDMIRFWVKEEDVILEKNIDVLNPSQSKKREGLGVYIKYESKTKKGKSLIGDEWAPYPDVWGKGEWVAETLEGARQMAIDFANGVS